MNLLIGRVAACLISFAAAWAPSSANASYIPFADQDLAQRDEPRRDIGAETDLYCIALAVYFEDGSTSETPDGQQQIARVVRERAKADRSKWGGRDVCDVVFYKRGGVCQFSFACLPLARRTPRGGSRWDRAMAVASEELLGNEAGAGARYYMNPAITSDRNACRFRKEFIPLFEAGRHEFFREPTECERYKAALELKKRLAKAAAEKRRKALAKKAAKKKTRYATK